MRGLPPAGKERLCSGFWKTEAKKPETGQTHVCQLPAYANGGNYPTGELFEAIVAFGRERGYPDCARQLYSFIPNDQPMSLLGVEGARDCVVELNSLSKSHNMAGWRAGMFAGQRAY